MAKGSLLTRKKAIPGYELPTKPEYTHSTSTPNPDLCLHLRAISPLEMNSLTSSSASSPEPLSKMRTANGANGTIRSVPSESLQLDARSSGEEVNQSLSRPDSSIPQSSSLPQMTPKPPLAWQNSRQLGIGNSVVRKLSSEFGPTKPYAGGLHVIENGSSSPNGDSSAQESSQIGGQCTCGHVTGRGIGGGKSTSTFIEKIMGEREYYKRELDAERMRTQEANDALGFAKARMDKIVSDHETEMHEANINKTLLKRKERQLEDMKGKIDIEKQRALAALEQERVWKRDLDTMEAKCRKKVDDAEGYAAMMEAQNNTMVRYWKKKQAELDQREAGMLQTHQEFLQLVRKESEKSKRVMAICDQYRAENDRISKINEVQNRCHENYKASNEESLQDIKRRGVEFGEKADTYLKEASELRDKLAWSLQVSKDFKDLPSPVDKLL